MYDVTVAQLPEELQSRLTVVPDFTALSRAMARMMADALEEKTAADDYLTVILPVGPLDYSLFADEINRRNLNCRFLRTVNMDEYLDDGGELIPMSHPLSFRRFMEENFFSALAPELRPPAENIVFPDPHAPSAVTELIDAAGGADLCWAGFGITGHVAFNDPPWMLGEPSDMASFRNCKTREVPISPMAKAQMAMGGTCGNLDIIPDRAVTIGMYELLKTRTFYLTFMRNWHAGLWRRALLGEISSSFPGSLLQEHPDLHIVMTELAAAPPPVNTQQATGEEQ